MTSTHHDTPTALPEIPAIDVTGLRKVALGAAVVGLGAFGVLAAITLGTIEEHGQQDIFFAYLCGFVFWASLPFGSILLTTVSYLTSASWGVVFRRLFQANMRTLPVMFLLFLPIAASLFVAHGSVSPYWWADQSWDGPINEVAAAKSLRVEAVEENQHKIHDFSNPGFFLLRTIGYFAICYVISIAISKFARPAEDQNDESAQWKVKNVAGPSTLIWTVTMTAAATDWVMSVEPTWASSMFPIVFGMNMFLTTFAFCAIVFYTINSGSQQVLSIVKDKFKIDIGTLTLGFTMVWAYASFSQYMLIWAGNLPEESVYYLKRGNGGWEYLAYGLMAFHWLIPFVLFLFREVKTDTVRMRALCYSLLIICACDVIWWLLPTVHREHGALHVPLAVAAIVGVGGLWGLMFTRELGKRPILPSNSETAFLATWGHH